MPGSHVDPRASQLEPSTSSNELEQPHRLASVQLERAEPGDVELTSHVQKSHLCPGLQAIPAGPSRTDAVGHVDSGHGQAYAMLGL